MHEIPAEAYRLAITVGDDDIDAQGHVSNVTIVKWLSRTAWQHAVALGCDMEYWRGIGGWFVVRRHEVDYLQSARLGDTVIVYTWPNAIGKVTAERRHVLVREADDAVMVRAVNTWAYVDVQTGRPKRIPSDVRGIFDPAKWVGD